MYTKYSTPLVIMPKIQWSRKDWKITVLTECDVSCGPVMDGLYYVACVPSAPTVLRVFIINGTRFCQILSASIDMNMWLLSFILSLWDIMLMDLRILYRPCIPEINPTWSWCMIFVMYCWIWCANILLRILHLGLSGILACNFLSS